MQGILEQMLLQVVASIDLTPEEQRFLHWIAGWDKNTVDNLCSIIKKCRKEEKKNES